MEICLDSYVGIPYLEGGRTRETGLDCYGLVRLFYRECMGLDLPDMPFMESWHEVDTEHRAGDVVLIRMPGNRTHAGVYLGNGQMLHAAPGGVVVQATRDFTRRVMGVYRYCL